MKRIAILLEYINKNYNALVEAYGKDLIDKLVKKFKEEASDLNIKNPTTNQPFTDDELKDLIKNNVPLETPGVDQMSIAEDLKELEQEFLKPTEIV